MAVTLDPDSGHPLAITNAAGTSALPSSRELATSLFKDGRKILLTMATVFGLCFLVALFTDSRYAAKSSLLVLLGPEYGYRAPAGENGVFNAYFDREAILQTEINILNSRPLLEQVIRTVGLERIYPDLADPGLLSRATAAIRKGIKSLTGTRSADDDDPVKLAVQSFSEDFEFEGERVGDVIHVAFTHEDPAIAAEVVNVTIRTYLEMRKHLFNDPQSSLVETQVADLQKALTEAQDQLQQYKASHDIADYGTQLDILLRRRGDLSRDQQEADNAVGQLTQRVAQLQAQLKTTPVDVTMYSDANPGERLKNVQTNLEDLKAREIDMMANYRPDSGPMREIREQIEKREAEINRIKRDDSAYAVRKGRNQVYDAISLELLKAQSDLSAAQARSSLDRTQLADLDKSIAELNQKRTDLGALERRAQAADEAFKSAAKIYADRRLTEDVSARKAANIRVIQPAEAPTKSTGVRKLIVIVGFVLALVSGAFIAISSEFNRRGFLSPEKLERSLGLPVLVSIPDSRALRHSGGPPPQSLPG